jgi:hypothetical protein
MADKQTGFRKEVSLKEIIDKAKPLDEILKGIDEFLLNLKGRDSIKPTDFLRSLIQMRYEYLSTTVKFTYNKFEENEQLVYRRIEEMQSLYSNLQQLSFLRNISDSDDELKEMDYSDKKEGK